MKRGASLPLIVLGALAALLCLAGLASASRHAEPAAPVAVGAPQAGAPAVVSYQGQVIVSGMPYSGTGYFKFAVVDTTPTTYWSNDGTSIGGNEPTTAVVLSVANGSFSTLLGDTSIMLQPLPATVFSGAERYLRAWFSTTGGGGTFAQLSPDRRIAAVPYALQAAEAASADVLDGQHADAFWRLAGNAGTDPATAFVGTTDNQALEVRVNNARALRLEPNAASPNVIGGSGGNWVGVGVFGATIGGGGCADQDNRVTGENGTVGGGRGNHAGDGAAATVGGGAQNTASGLHSVVGGGLNNRASGAGGSVVAGGEGNEASGLYAAIPGGVLNMAVGDFSFAAGRRARANRAGCFAWADSTDADFACSTDNQFAVRAGGGVSFQTGAAAVQVNGNSLWHAGNDGPTSGLDADLLDGYHAGNGSGEVPVSNGALNAGLNADLLDGQEGSAYQQRVSGACAAGSMVRAVNADGTVACELDAPLRRSAPPQGNVLTTVDAAGVVGTHTCITIGADGLPVVSYYDSDNHVLKVLHCGNATCTIGNITTTVDATGIVGWYSSIAIGADGLPVVSYYDASNIHLKVLHCGDGACTTGNTLTTVDSSGSVGMDSSITIGADGLPVISYLDGGKADLKVLHCGDAACTTGNTATTVDSTDNVGAYTSIALGADGLPVVSYYDSSYGNLKVLHCGDDACMTRNITTTVDATDNVGEYSSITIGADGLPVISYIDSTNQDLKVLHCGNSTCTTGNAASTVDSTVNVNQYTSITIGADGLPVISYYDGSYDDLRVLHCADVACATAAISTTVDSTGYVGSHTSITIGADGLPVISYFDSTNGHLKVVHCSSVFCVPYWRRR